MAIHVDLTSTFGSPRSAGGDNKVQISWFEIDFTKSGWDLEQNQIMEICAIPAGAVIKSAFVKVNTAQSDVTDVDIGVTTGTSTVANIFDGISMASTGYIAANNLTVTNGGTYQTAASKLLITNKDANTLNTAKIKVGLEVGFFVDALDS